jgi:hypothetical protein
VLSEISTDLKATIGGVLGQEIYQMTNVLTGNFESMEREFNSLNEKISSLE